MKKDTQDLLIRVGVIVGAYFLIVKPLLETLNIIKTKQEKVESQDEINAQKEQANIKVPAGRRTYSDVSLNALAKEMYDSADKFAYDYPIIMRSYAYFSGFTNADALYFLQVFVKRNGLTLYQWYVDKFQNSTNFKSVYNYITELNKYEKNYAKFGYQKSLFNQSFDVLSEKAVGYVYAVAKVNKG